MLKQLTGAIPAMYMNQFRNNVTNSITTDVPTILHTLFTTYGDIDDEDVLDENEVRSHSSRLNTTPTGYL